MGLEDAVTELKLRDYQTEAIQAVFDAWEAGMRRPAIVLPTGAGKTVVFAHLIKQFRVTVPHTDILLASRYGAPGNRVMVLVHRDELADQAIEKIRAVAPGLNVGKVKAESNDIDSDVMVCSVQTLASAKRRNELVHNQGVFGDVGLIITDECHHAAAASYKRVYAAFPDALQLGVTATMARGDGVGLGSVWDDVVFKRSVLWMISKGHLVDVRTQRVDLDALDMSAVASTKADWRPGDLGRALMEAEADTAIALAYAKHAGDRQGIVFTPTVETAEAAAEALNRAGIVTRVISGETPREDRADTYARFRTGKVQVLSNCMVLTEGFDAPCASVAMIARPTQSATLYTQMVGRVLRLHPGKTEALVLDLVGASAHKLRTLVDLNPGDVMTVKNGESLAEAVVREAEEQNRKVPAGSIAFELKVRDVDTFGSSTKAWSRTHAGVWFISGGTTRTFLWPAEGGTGLWDVCTAAVDGATPWVRTEYTGLEIGTAMAWGEAVADEYAGFSIERSARWRAGSPSPKQVNYAAALGIAGAEGMGKGQLSDAMDMVLASQFFDPYVKG